MKYSPPTDTAFSAELRRLMHAQGIAARVGFLGMAAQMALRTLPPGAWHDKGALGLRLVAQVAAGERVEQNDLLDTMHDETDDGALVYAQMVTEPERRQAWLAVASAIGYAAWEQCRHVGESANSLIENYGLQEALDICVDTFVGVPSLDPAALSLAADWARAHPPIGPDSWEPTVPLEYLATQPVGG